MALNSSRSVLSSTCKALQQYSRSSQPLQQSLSRRLLPSAAPIRHFTSSPTCRSDKVPPTPTIFTEDEINAAKNGEQPPAELPEQQPAEPPAERPRWTYTPEKMKGPGFSINIVKDPRRTIWKNNEDPVVVDTMYKRLLGPGGDKMLPDEIKWMAITHKSFDQGRRGFNTRLAYFGRQILALESTREIMVSPAAQGELITDRYNREPFDHPAMANVDKLAFRQPRDLIHKDRVAKLALEVGMMRVVRWKPRLPENLEGSGLTVVLNTAIFAIVGAISLQHGAEVAQRVVREKILKKLGP
ncbi:ribonuclease-III-like-domain-containing protein [Apodospora peruviana]|uniref:Ribonuclease-III-like-domain-containing protein n=1 Tax=Apodospora peruviana TaxID=516989 RepID=A0AAE0MA10_9PEZI|nr:ribonuclease-III-like-domain-containing protein [Apodospora peruviana]